MTPVRILHALIGVVRPQVRGAALNLFRDDMKDSLQSLT